MKNLLTMTQRKFGLVVGVITLSFLSNWAGTLPAEYLQDVIIWVSGLYFGANVSQKVLVK